MFFPIIVLAFHFYSIPINACTCVQMEPEIIYCLSDWVAIVQVLKATSANYFMGKKYEVNVLQTFKPVQNGLRPNETTTIIGKNDIYTTSNEAACGLSKLKFGKKYLLAGGINKDGKMNVQLCGQFDFGTSLYWENVPFELRKNLEIKKLDGFNCSGIGRIQ